MAVAASRNNTPRRGAVVGFMGRWHRTNEDVWTSLVLLEEFGFLCGLILKAVRPPSTAFETILV